ncbi:MAG: CrcB family protein [Verrucomicrobiota bacterium]|nr:CrcB family protein [Verrucomicrobiota bacterium]
MRQLLCLWFGSGLGGCLRYLLDLLVLNFCLAALPVSTFLINVSGSLLIGYLAGVWARGGALSPQSCMWHFWITGFCGGYTTFSTFSWQVLDLVRAGQGTLAGAYAAGSIAFGMLAVWFGLSLAMRVNNAT